MLMMGITKYRYDGNASCNSNGKAAAGGFHVAMMGYVGMGNNPMVGATVAVAVAIEEAAK